MIIHFKEDVEWDKIITVSKYIFEDFIEIIQKWVWKNTKVVTEKIK